MCVYVPSLSPSVSFWVLVLIYMFGSFGIAGSVVNSFGVWLLFPLSLARAPSGFIIGMYSGSASVPVFASIWVPVSGWSDFGYIRVSRDS
eukprot:g54134.t1